MSRFCGVLLLALVAGSLPAQQLTGYERQRGLDMLGAVRDDIIKNYYDTLYQGIDFAGTFRTAESRIRSATSVEQVLGIIAQATASLHDLHTLFLPPGLVYRAEYGWELRFVGDTCRVREVTAGSDAERQGVRPGDAVLAVQGIPVTRGNLWQLEYLLHGLRPSSSVRMQVQSPGKEPRQLDLAARVTERHSLIEPGNSIDLWQFLRDEAKNREENAVRWMEVGQPALILRLPIFLGDGAWVDKFTRLVRDHGTVIIDLRGNPGGGVDLLTRFLGVFYETDLAVAKVIERKKTSELKVKGRGDQRYSGKVIVLVDAGSASASELFARAIQLTGRGRVLGDRSAGAVRVSRFFGHASGTQTAAFYGASVTIADVIMSDGAALEGAGVTPDELILPTGEQMGRREDPVLARALALAGVDWTPERAGRSW